MKKLSNCLICGKDITKIGGPLRCFACYCNISNDKKVQEYLDNLTTNP